MVLTLVVMGSIVYDAVQAGLRGNTKSILISTVVLLIATFCIVIVNTHSNLIRRRQKAAEAPVSSPTLQVYSSRGCDHMYRHTPPLIHSGVPGTRYIPYEDVSVCDDLPPDYDVAAVTNKTRAHKKPMLPATKEVHSKDMISP